MPDGQTRPLRLLACQTTTETFGVGSPLSILRSAHSLNVGIRPRSRPPLDTPRPFAPLSPDAAHGLPKWRRQAVQFHLLIHRSPLSHIHDNPTKTPRVSAMDCGGLTPPCSAYGNTDAVFRDPISGPAVAIRLPCPRALRHASRKGGVKPPQSMALRAAHPSHPTPWPPSEVFGEGKLDPPAEAEHEDRAGAGLSRRSRPKADPSCMTRQLAL